MTKWLLGLAAAVGFGSAAVAQYPNQPYPPGYGGYGGGYGGYGGAMWGGYPGGGYGGYGAGMYPGQFMPNYYNPQNQPLSPYLNLLRGGNLATNYYYGVRPGTVGGAGGFGAGFGNFPIGATSPLRTTGFLPAAANPTQEPVELPPAGAEIASLPPSGHPVFFGGTGRFFPGGAGMGGRPGFIGNRPPGMTGGGTGTAGAPGTIPRIR